MVYYNVPVSQTETTRLSWLITLTRIKPVECQFGQIVLKQGKKFNLDLWPL